MILHPADEDIRLDGAGLRGELEYPVRRPHGRLGGSGRHPDHAHDGENICLIRIATLYPLAWKRGERR